MSQYTIKHISPEVKGLKTKVGPKILVNPYYGCEHKCLFCPANDGFLKKKVFDDFREKGFIYVVDNIIEHVDNYIADNNLADFIHLSPVSDPFQPIENIEHSSEKIINFANEKGYPVALCTKGRISEHLILKIAENKKSFVQISLLTINEEKRKKLVRGNGATVNDLLCMISKLTDVGIMVIGRIDPIFPYITDDLEEFESLVIELKKRGVTNILSSVADIIPGALEREYDYLNSIQPKLAEKYSRLYTEQINGRLHAKIEYRENMFKRMRGICEIKDMKFGITWEPDERGNSINNKYSHELVGAEKE